LVTAEQLKPNINLLILSVGYIATLASYSTLQYAVTEQND